MKRPVTTLIAILVLSGGAWLLWRLTSPGSSSQSVIPDPQSTISGSQSPILTPSVAALLTKESVPLPERLNLLATIGNKLPSADRKALLDSIGNTPPNGLTTADWHSLANDILQALRNQQPYTPEYTDRLLALWHEKTLDPTLRDYVLQQLREWIADGDTRTTHEERPEKIALIRQTFLQAVTPGHSDCDPQSTTTGTALVSRMQADRRGWTDCASWFCLSRSRHSTLLPIIAGRSSTDRSLVRNLR